MRQNALHPSEVMKPGLSVWVAATSSDKERMWPGTVVSLDRRVLTVQMNRPPAAPPQPRTTVMIHAQVGGLRIDFGGQVQRYAADPCPYLLITIPPRVEVRSLRRFTRAPLESPAHYRWYATQRAEPYPMEEGRLINVSRGGAALAVRQAPENERLIEVCFTVPPADPVDAECVKRHVRPNQGGDYPFVIGLKFVMILSNERKAIGRFAGEIGDALQRDIIARSEPTSNGIAEPE